MSEERILPAIAKARPRLSADRQWDYYCRVARGIYSAIGRELTLNVAAARGNIGLRFSGVILHEYDLDACNAHDLLVNSGGKKRVDAFIIPIEGNLTESED